MERLKLVHICSVIDCMRHSHQSIRKLLRGEQSASAVDALAIARVQVENVFTICFMLQSPQNVRLHLKNAWKNSYVRFLLERAELAHLPRFAEYYTETAPPKLDQLQGISFVSDEERRTIDIQQIGCPFGPSPELVRMDGFPTPAEKVVKKIHNHNRRKMLARLNAEYEFLCAFAHAEGESLVFRA